MVTSENIKELRNKTSVSIMACKNALEEAGGDMEKAILLLRKAGLKVADKKSSRSLNAGLVESYLHAGGSVGVLVEGRCETDFVSKNDDFKSFLHDIAMHIAAADPYYVSSDDIDEKTKGEITEIFTEEVSKIDKPQEIKDKMLEGKIDSYFKERVLMNQQFVKNPDLTVETLVKDAIQKFGENVEISRFSRFSV